METFTIFFMIIVAVILILISTLMVMLYTSSSKYPKIEEYREECFYYDSSSNSRVKFPSLDEETLPLCTLSVIVPAYNEELRLPPMLEETFDYLEERAKEKGFTYEIIVVDDGSKDSTSNIALKYNVKYGSQKIRILTLVKNRGKGGAVRLGMLRARGEMLLFADADGATKFSDFHKVENSLKLMNKDESNIRNSLAIVCGSRAHLEEESVASRSFFRTILMYGFHFFVWFFTVRNVRDTQCGFKLLTRRTARIIFGSLHVERWAFDVELLFIAQSLGIPVEEVAVNWTEIDGSKLTPVISWIQMGMDIVAIWFRYKVGAWKIRGEFSRKNVTVLENH